MGIRGSALYVVVDEFLLAEVRPDFSDDEGYWNLAFHFVWDRNDTDVPDIRMRGEDVLDFGREDVFASHFHLVIDAPTEGVPAVGAARHHIPGIDPAIPEALCLGFWTVVIAEGIALAPHDKLSCLSLWQNVPVGVDDLAFVARKSGTYRSQLILAAWVEGDDGARLRQSVPFDYIDTRQGLDQFIEKRGCHGSRPHCDELEAGGIHLRSLSARHPESACTLQVRRWCMCSRTSRSHQSQDPRRTP